MASYIRDESTLINSDAQSRSGRALTFDGMNDYVQLPDLGITRTTQYTFSGWFYVTSLSGNWPLFMHSNSASDRNGLLIQGSRNILGGSYNGSAYDGCGSAAVIADNAWYHIVYVRNGGAGDKIYVNGNDITAAGTATALSLSQKTLGTSDDGSLWFGGKMHDVRFYGRNLTAAEITALYNATKQSGGNVAGTLYAADLVGMWPLEGNGLDMSGNGHDGTLTGPVEYLGADVPSSIYNELGYTLNGGTYYYADATDLTKDIQGNALANRGPLAKRAQPKASPCATFDGLNDYAATMSAIVSGTEFSVSFRIYRSAAGAYQAVIGDWGNDGAKRWIVYSTNTNTIGIYVSDNGTQYLRVDTTSTLAANTWTQVTATWTATGNVVKIYFDGVEQATTVVVSRTISSIANVATQFRIASSTGAAEFLTGRLCDARIHNRVLTPAEVVSIFVGNDIASGLLADWAMDEKSGLTLLDSSGNGYHATASGMTSGELWANTQDNYHAALMRGIRTGQGKRGYRTFDGSTQYFSSSSGSRPSIGGDVPFWVVAEVTPSTVAVGGATIISKFLGGSNAKAFILYRSGADLYFGISSDGTALTEVTKASALTAGTKTLITCYHDPVANTIGIATNGGAFTTASYSSGIYSTTTSVLKVGAHETATNPWSGNVHLAAMGQPVSSLTWSTLRDAIYNSGTPLSYSDLTATQLADWGVKAWYDCDEWGPSLRDKHAGLDLTGTGYNADYPVPAPAGLIAAPTREYGTFVGAEKFAVADSASLSMSGDDAFWACGWVRINSLSSVSKAIIGQHLATGNQLSWVLYANEDDAIVTVSGDGTATTSATLAAQVSLGSWAFFIAYHDPTANTIGIAKNGGAFTTAAHAAGVFNSTAPICIGASGNADTYFMQGAIAFAAYGKSPTSTFAEIRDLIYNSGTPLQYSDLSAAQKTALGLVEWFEVGDYQGEEKLIGKHAATVMTGSCIPSRTTQGGPAKLPPINTSIDFTGTTLSGGTAAPWTASQYLGYLTCSGAANGRVVTSAIVGKVTSGAISVYIRLRNFNAAGVYAIFDNDNGATGSRAFFGTNSGNLAIYDTAYRNLGASLAGVLNEGSWHDVMFVWSVTNAKLYVDGLLWGEATTGSTLATVAAGWTRSKVLSTADDLQKLVGDVARFVVADGIRVPGTILTAANLLDLRFDSINCEDEQGRIPSSAWLSGHTANKITVPTAYKSGVILPEGMSKVATSTYERRFNLFKRDQ